MLYSCVFSLIINLVMHGFTQMFTSTHYGGKEINTEFRNGEAWKKVLGPSLVYLNSASSKDKTLTLWTDAKTQVNFYSNALCQIFM